MENLHQDELLNIGINMLRFSGESKRRTTITLLFFRIFNLCVIALTIVYVIINFFRITKEFYIKTLQAFISMLHLLLKYLLFIFYKSDIEKLLTDITTKSWNYRKFNKDFRESIAKTIKKVKYIQILIVTLLFLMLFMYLLRQIFTSSWFLLESAIPSSDGLGAILLLCQYHSFYLGTTVVFSYDLIYLAVCAHISLQVKLLKRKIKEVLTKCDESTLPEMKKCVEHHQLLLNVFSRAKNVYSVMLLFHYFVTLVTACSDLFELVLARASMTDSLLKLISVLLFIGQFAYYAIPAEQVAFEFSDVPNAIYLSEWYNNDLRTQKTVLYIMTNSLRINYFSGLGLMDINVDAFGSVVRKTFSFYTILAHFLKQ